MGCCKRVDEGQSGGYRRRSRARGSRLRSRALDRLAGGTPIRQLIPSKDFTETYSANGLSLTTKSPGSALITIDPTTGEIIITVRGNSRHLIVPGIGPVLATAGHFLIDGNGNLIDISGLNIPAGSEFCAALSS